MQRYPSSEADSFVGGAPRAAAAPSGEELASRMPTTFAREIAHYGITADVAGKGQFAKVYVAYDKRDGRKLAARVVAQEHEDVVEESKVLRKLHKLSNGEPCCVEYENKFNNGKHYILFTEFCEGGTLEQVLKRGPMAYTTARRLFRQIARALSFMSDAKIAHRDLKPANVMLTSSDLGRADIRLIDFGFAKRASLMVSYKGTPAYMAPERIMGDEYGFAAEVYAAGIMLFEMLFGFRPFSSAESRIGLYRAQENLVIPDSPPVPPEAKDCVLRCLTFDSKSRMSVEDLQTHPFVAASSPPAVRSGSASGAASLSPPTLDTSSHAASLETPVSLVSHGFPSGSPKDPLRTAPGSAMAGDEDQTTGIPAPDPTVATPTSQTVPGAGSGGGLGALPPLAHGTMPRTGAVAPGNSTPMVHHGGSGSGRPPPAPPAMPQPMAGDLTSPVPQPPKPQQHHVDPASDSASPPMRFSAQPSLERFASNPLGMPEDGPGGTLLEGAAAILGLLQDPSISAGDRIVLASYAVESAQRASKALLDAAARDSASSTPPMEGAGVPPTTTKTTTTSTNMEVDGGLKGSFTHSTAGGARLPSSSFALSALSSVSLIKTKCKAAVKEAMNDLRDIDNAATLPPQQLLLNYVRRALLVAGRHEYLGEPHCAYGPVLEVYTRCDILLALLQRDDSLTESVPVRKLRERLADRIVAAHSSTGVFADFAKGDLYRSSATRLA